jgi:hypothetical protein
VGDEVMVVVVARHANGRRELRRSNPASVLSLKVSRSRRVLVVAAGDRRRRRAGPRDAEWAAVGSHE